jgi:hypothetical protein
LAGGDEKKGTCFHLDSHLQLFVLLDDNAFWTIWSFEKKMSALILEEKIYPFCEL